MKELSTETLLELIKKSLKHKQPLSIIRYGDGEAIVLNGFKDTSSFKMVLKRQLGYIPRIDHAEEITRNLIEAYNGCDIIGIPLVAKAFKDEKDYWSRAVDILKEEVKETLLEEKGVVSIDCHSHFLDKDYYTQLLTDLDTLNYISCRDLDEQFKKKFNIKRVNRFAIPPEAKFSANVDLKNRHYPDQFNTIQRWMDRAISCEGSLCLTGAGFVGKIYNNWFRDRGGVAMDVGSVFDSWAGLVTRGSGRGVGVIDNKYKL